MHTTTHWTRTLILHVSRYSVHASRAIGNPQHRPLACVYWNLFIRHTSIKTVVFISDTVLLNPKYISTNYQLLTFPWQERFSTNAPKIYIGYLISYLPALWKARFSTNGQWPGVHLMNCIQPRVPATILRGSGSLREARFEPGVGSGANSHYDAYNISLVVMA